MSNQPISTQKPNDFAGRGCLILFGSIFALSGLFFFWMTSISPLLSSRAASNWPEEQCTVTVSEVDVNRDSEGTTYRPRIEFDYEFDGQKHHSESFDFTSLNRSKSRCREIVNAHPVGTRMGCFVNPNNPEEAVIDRSYDFSWFGFFFPLIFVGVGTAIILGSIFLKNKSSKSVSGYAKMPANEAPSSLTQTSDGQSMPAIEHPGDVEDRAWDEPQKLKPTQTRLTKFVLALLFAVFWNGITATGLYATLAEGFDWFILFFIPFVLVGIGLFVAAVYLLGNLFNPEVELALSTGAVPRGDSVDIAWQLSGRTSSIKNLKVIIEGEESATYRRGTDTVTATNVFCTIPVCETTTPEEIEFGNATVPIPADTMHTFAADRNEIQWRIVLHGSIPWWPDVKETFKFRVKP